MASGVTFTPADLPNLYDYWEADSGVTGTTNVTQWTGIANSELFTYPVNTNGPEVVSSAAGFNSQDILRFDRANSEGLYFSLGSGATIGTSTQVNYTIYADPEPLASGTWRMFWGLSRPTNASPSDFVESMVGSNSNNLTAYTFDGSGTATNLGLGATPKQMYTMAVDYANGECRFYNGTSQDSASPISATNLNTKTTRQIFTLALYNPESGPGELPGSMDLAAAAIWTGNTDFSTNLSNLEAYYQAKYGV